MTTIRLFTDESSKMSFDSFWRQHFMQITCHGTWYVQITVRLDNFIYSNNNKNNNRSNGSITAPDLMAKSSPVNDTV